MSDLAEGRLVPQSERSRRKWRFGQLLGLLGLTGFALSQPILSMAGESPTLFTYHDVQGLGLVIFALAVALIPPIALWAVVVVVGLVNRRWGDGVFIAMAVVLAAAAIMQVLRAVGVDGAALVSVLAVVAAVGFGGALVRFDTVRAWLRYTAVLPALAVIVFLVASPTSDLLRARDAGAKTLGANLPTVVFLMLDELPTQSLLGADGTIDPARFPNLASLAADATWYRDYSVLATYTDVSVPAILSGAEPRAGQALWTSYPDTIFSLLQPTHDVTSVEAFTELCGFPECAPDGVDGTRGEEPRVGELSSRVAELWWQRLYPPAAGSADLAEFGDEAVESDLADTRGGSTTDEDAMRQWAGVISARPANAARFVNALAPSTDPAFYYLHLMYPHQPWTYYPDGTRYSSGEASELLNTMPSDWAAAVEEQQHLWQARYADAVVGQVLERLRQTGLYDDAVIVVTSDHGVALEGTSTKGRAVQSDTVTDLAYAPLVIKEPGQTVGRVDDSNLLAIDLLPTVAEAVGVEIPWRVPGYPAGSPEIEERGDDKLIYDFGADPLRPKLVDILRFDSASRRPTIDRRRVGPRNPTDSFVAGLVRGIGLDGLLGRKLDHVVTVTGGTAAIVDLDGLRAPTPGQDPPGFVGGVIEGPGGSTEQRFVVVATNGEIVTAAPVGDEGTFSTLLPLGAIRRDGNDIRVALVDGNDVIELDVS